MQYLSSRHLKASLNNQGLAFQPASQCLDDRMKHCCVVIDELHLNVFAIIL